MEPASRELTGKACAAIGEVERTLRSMVAKAFVSTGPPRNWTEPWSPSEWWRGYIFPDMIERWNERKNKAEQENRSSRGDLWAYASLEDLPKIMSRWSVFLWRVTHVFRSPQNVYHLIAFLHELMPLRQAFSHQTEPVSFGDAMNTVKLLQAMVDIVPSEYHDSADLNEYLRALCSDLLKEEQARGYVGEKNIEQSGLADVGHEQGAQGFDAALDKLALQSESRSAMQEHEDIIEHLIKLEEHNSVDQIRTAVALARIKAINFQKQQGGLSGESYQQLLAAAQGDIALLEKTVTVLRNWHASVIQGAASNDVDDNSDDLYDLFRAGFLTPKEYEESSVVVDRPNECARAMRQIIEAIESELSLAKS
jgi:hypothetical protein